MELSVRDKGNDTSAESGGGVAATLGVVSVIDRFFATNEEDRRETEA
jgi:hypothetical protein